MGQGPCVGSHRSPACSVSRDHFAARSRSLLIATTAWSSSPMVGDHLGVNELHPVDVGRWRRSWACAGRMGSESDVKVAVLSRYALNAPLR
jgi:hypothetical protein